jgi:hypothetical protein
MDWENIDDQTVSSDWDDESLSFLSGPSFISYLLADSDILVDQQEDDDNATDHALESHMNAAGRSSMHPVGDLRSASYARQRSRLDKKAPRVISITCRKWNHSENRLENKRKKREIVRHEIRCSERRPHGLLDEKERVDAMEGWRDDVYLYIKYRKHAAVFQSNEAYTEHGELFAEWAQRRIAEMRAVKEDRLCVGEPAVQPATVFCTGRMFALSANVYETFSGTPHTTTLPTNSYDALGHGLLRAALTPSKGVRRKAKFDPSVSIFPVIHGYSWFGEYTWQWHRDAFGCWEFGQWGECRPADRRRMYGECYCNEFGDDEPAPDDVQRCNLLEWVGMQGRALMAGEESEKEVETSLWRRASVEDEDSICGSEWSIVDSGSGISMSLSL